MAIERIILNDNVVEYDTDEFEVESSGSVQYLHYIGNGSKPVINPKGNTSCYRMFYHCEGLEQLDLSKFDTSLVTNMNSMFEYCDSLEQLDFSNFDTSAVTNMNHMFAYCYNLKKLDLSKFDTRSVTDMGEMFYNCRSLKQLDLSNFNTSSVTDMGNMFYNCKSLKQLKISKVDSESANKLIKLLSDRLSEEEKGLKTIIVASDEVSSVWSKKGYKNIISADSKAVSKGNEQGKRLGREELSVQESSAIFHSIDAFPLLSLAGYSGLDTGVSSSFEGVVFIGDHLKDILLEKIDVKDWYIKDVSGTTVVLTADNKIGFAISPDGSKIKTRGLKLSKTEKSSIKEMLKNGINDICNIINKPLKVINISNNGSMLQNSYLVESLEEEGSWDLFLE